MQQRQSRGMVRNALRDLKRPPSAQISFLDGLRTIAILLVLNGHLNGEFEAIHGSNWYGRLPFVLNGWIGVDLFFVLSGFFIGGQLWKELRDHGSISFSKFVIRRGLRIWPLYFFTFLCVLAWYGHSTSDHGYGWSDIAFITNYHNRGIVLGSWSLCTEEQFYIVTPLALLLLSSFVKSLRRFRAGLWTLLVLIPAIRALTWVAKTGGFFVHSPETFKSIYYNFHTHCDGLMVGLIISNLWVSRDHLLVKLRPRTVVIIGFSSLALLHALQKEIFIFTGLGLFFGSLVWYGLKTGSRVFNSRIFYWLSRLSFGMYLNHEYMRSWILNSVVARLPVSPSGVPAELLAVFLLTICSACLALVTFCLVEFPFLELRKKLIAHKTQPVAIAAVSAS